jgi:single-stranded-DNA-specific exonuclease
MERRLPHRDQATLLLSFMKIAAIATIADSVPLVGENRVIASLGLNALRKAVNPGLKALLEVAELGGKGLSSGEVAFRIAPRINAAGRMDVAADVIELFSTRDPTQAHQIAARLDKLNSERQEEEKRILIAIEQRLANQAGLRDSYCLVIDGDGWHRGEDAHGSGRSIPAFHLLNALESCAPLFSRFGGHAYAVGFSLRSCNVSRLRSQLDTYARTQLSLADFEPTLNVDAELPLDAITPDLFETIRKLEPFGAGNPGPAFCATARLSAPVKAVGKKHVRMKLAPGLINGAANGWRRALVHNAVGWRLAERVAEAKLLAGDMLDVAFTLDQNENAEFGGIELSLRDFRTRAAGSSNDSTSAVSVSS